jgi:hypothetical protein
MSREEDRGEAADPSREEAIRIVRAALERIEFGSVVVTVHQGEVVGIETSTKLRLNSTK